MPRRPAMIPQEEEEGQDAVVALLAATMRRCWAQEPAARPYFAEVAGDLSAALSAAVGGGAGVASLATPRSPSRLAPAALVVDGGAQ